MSYYSNCYDFYYLNYRKKIGLQIRGIKFNAKNHTYLKYILYCENLENDILRLIKCLK